MGDKKVANQQIKEQLMRLLVFAILTLIGFFLVQISKIFRYTSMNLGKPSRHRITRQKPITG